MSFVPNTDDERKQMLDAIGVKSFDELIGKIPESVRLKRELNLPQPMSELEVVQLLQSLANKNKDANSFSSFLGGGSYDHFIPAIVGSVLERPEFKTAYTPYQAEVSQGTLQAMYEFQSMICALTGMDVANASMYDGGSALAEACMLAIAHNKRTEIVYAGTVNPNYKRVVDTICAGKNLTYQTLVAEDGSANLAKLKEAVTAKTSAVIVQHPNVYGNLEEVQEIEAIAHANGALFVVIIDPISLGLIQPPGEFNADIVVGEGQSLGISMSFGGPYLGLFAAKKEFVRKIPGRLSGVTQDSEGTRGFVLTLQTREQQIKREKATSNICTNQGLLMLAATVYLTAMGKQGMKEVAELCFKKAHYLAEKISHIPGFSLNSTRPFFKEFLVKTPIPAAVIIEGAEKEGILAGIDTSRFPDMNHGMLIAVTEKRTKAEMDALVEFLKKYGR